MDLGREHSYQGYPGQVCWTPASQDFSDPNLNFENGESATLGITSFSFLENKFGSEGVSDINGGIYDSSFSVNNNVWNTIPCTDLLALADTSITINGGAAHNDVNMQFEKQDGGTGFTPDSQQYGQPNRTRYLFDLNSPPAVTETQFITSISSQLTSYSVTPKQTRRPGRGRLMSDIINSIRDGATNQAAINIEEPEVTIEQTQETNWHLDVNEDFDEGSSDNSNIQETPQPKQKRRKHRPKVVIEGQSKSTKKAMTPKADASSKGKRKYIRKSTPLNSTTESTELPIVRPTRNSCRRKINFEEEYMYDKAFSMSPITPNKSEIKKDAKNTSSRAKCHINFSSKPTCSTNDDALGTRYESLEAYLSMITNFPAIYKKKRTEKSYSFGTPRAVFPVWSHNMSTMYRVNSQQQSYKNMLGFGHVENFRKKRTKGVKRMRDLASFAGIIEGKRHTCMEALAVEFTLNIAKKKRTKRNSIVPSSYHNHRLLTNHLGFHQSLTWRNRYDINALINQFEKLSINDEMVERDKHALVPYLTRYRERNGLVLYRQERSVVPFEDSYNGVRIRKPRPKVDLDDETSRVWKLLLEDINSQGIDGTDEDNTKRWEEERNVFSGRAASFIARMHLVQGDRRFSRWKGSVVDSVTGVFLTQNVSDHLSSSAFMNLAAKYPLKSKSINEQFQEEKSSIYVKEPCQVDLEETIKWHGENSSQQLAQDYCSVTLPDAYPYEEKEVEDFVSSRNSVDRGANSEHPPVYDTAEHLISCLVTNSRAQYASPATGEINEFIKLGEERTVVKNKLEGKCAREQSGISAQYASPATGEIVERRSFQESPKFNNSLQDEGKGICECQTLFGNSNIVTNQQTEISEVIETNLNEHTNHTKSASGSTIVKKGKNGKTKKKKVDWDSLRKSAQVKKKREKTLNTMDSLDYEAVRRADVNEISDTIKDRGMNNMLAERIKAFLNRLVRDHGSIDLEWLRDVPPDKAKEYLLSFRGLGLKSVECVRLLTLHHLAFPVDTNVGRIAVRLGWVPLQPLPESLQLHLLELYPVLETIQKYLWPRLCKLDQRTLYELHYQMITFGKVFCTKNKPNCNACPMRGECRHFASAFASARLALPAPEDNSIVTATENKTPGQSQIPTGMNNQHHITLPPGNLYMLQPSEDQNHDPIIEEPTTPEPVVEVRATPEPDKIQQEFDIEDFCEDDEEIPMIRLNMESFTQNLQTYMENNMELAEGDMSRALVALTSEAASIPTPKLKNVSQLRTEHQVYELPDSHPLLEGLDKREPDDPCSYLLAIWTPGETAESIQPPKGQCCSQESGMLCQQETCFVCNGMREASSQTVRGTLLIPCRTAMRGSFPLNGTYFQVNEVFADHDSSLNPIDVPRSWLWNLPRRTVYFGTSIPTIFKGLTTEGIQYCFWRGFVCVRGFDQKTRAPRPLMARLHFPVSKLKRSRGKTDED